MIQIKIGHDTTGFDPNPVHAWNETQGLDYDWNGEDWVSCGSPIGTGKTIQEAIDDLLDQLPEGITYQWK